MVDGEGEDVGHFAMEEARDAAHDGADVVRHAIRHGKRRLADVEGRGDSSAWIRRRLGRGAGKRKGQDCDSRRSSYPTRPLLDEYDHQQNS